MKLSDAINIEDIRLLAKGYLPRIAFDFIDGGLEDEVGLKHNREVFTRYKLVPRYLVNVANRSQEVTLFGHRYRSPFGICPMGICGFFRPGADLMLARAAAAAGVPYLMSSASCDSIERAMAVAPETTWFQIYGARRPSITSDLVRRATDAGVRTLVMTIDTPVIGKRERNLRNGFTRPMKMTPSVIMQGLARPAWTWRYLRKRGIPLMENWAPYAENPSDANSVADLYGSQTPAPEQAWEVLEHVRAAWKGPLVVKGVLHPDDAKRCLEIGAQGLIVSNHGGRQLDAAPSAIEMLPSIKEAVGDRMELIVDGGFRRGSDIVTAIALGAKAAFFGRPAIYGAAVSADAGARKVLDIFRHELDLVMAQIGATRIEDIGPHMILDPKLAHRHP